MGEVTLSAKNQIVIPREAGKARALEAGDKLVVVQLGEDSIVLGKPKS